MCSAQFHKEELGSANERYLNSDFGSTERSPFLKIRLCRCGPWLPVECRHPPRTPVAGSAQTEAGCHRGWDEDCPVGERSDHGSSETPFGLQDPDSKYSSQWDIITVISRSSVS